MLDLRQDPREGEQRPVFFFKDFLKRVLVASIRQGGSLNGTPFLRGIKFDAKMHGLGIIMG